MEKGKKSNWNNIFGLLAGLAIGIGGKLFYDELCKPKNEDSIAEIYNIENKVTNEWNDYEAFICPITQEIMLDPVITPHGISYERIAILKWLCKNKSCPMTKNNLSKDDLITNYALKQSINEYIKQKKNSDN